ncbi:MAG: hypothetical protein ACM31C_33075 [Acidobacteriota bacterium]
MSGMVCPACGVAVTPGYVRCPKCKKPLPRRATTSAAQGGTAVVDRRPPWKLIGIVALALVVIGGVWQGRKAFRDYRSKVAAGVPRDAADVPAAPAPSQGPAPAPGPSPAPPPAAAPSAPDAGEVANELHRSLERAQLWSTVEIVGDHVDVRSSSCGDPQMRPMLDGAAGGFKAAGLTRLRCLEQSGTVVFQRDL